MSKHSFTQLLTTVAELEDLVIRQQKLFQPGNILCLQGEIGAGKTTTAKAIGKALQIQEEIISPTYQLESRYQSGKIPVVHYDLYRLRTFQEIQQIGMLETVMDPSHFIMIEWPEIILNYLPLERVFLWKFNIIDSTRTLTYETLD
jgi:tRNA threonylcarbamoyladenosine biosynthesis protein TsaE